MRPWRYTPHDKPSRSARGVDHLAGNAAPHDPLNLPSDMHTTAHFFPVLGPPLQCLGQGKGGPIVSIRHAKGSSRRYGASLNERLTTSKISLGKGSIAAISSSIARIRSCPTAYRRQRVNGASMRAAICGLLA